MSVMGKFSSGFGRLLRAREKQAERSVHAYLATLDDAALKRVGFERSELKAGGSINHFI